MKNIYIVESLEEMLEVSIRLHEAAKLIEPLGRYNPFQK